MKHAACAALLEWALPRLGLRWPGFSRARGQVCKRIARRRNELGLPDLVAYRRYLEEHPEEWGRLDEMCRVSISRFYRDRDVFAELGQSVLPELARAAEARERRLIRAWSAGCAGGEEPYTLAMVWRQLVAARHPSVQLRVLATDADPAQVERAAAASYSRATLRDVPEAWLPLSVTEVDHRLRVCDELRALVELRTEDIRTTRPDGPFDLILCRNSVFTYFEERLQRELLTELTERLAQPGFLVIGKRERLPDCSDLVELAPGLGVFRHRLRSE